MNHHRTSRRSMTAAATAVAAAAFVAVAGLSPTRAFAQTGDQTLDFALAERFAWNADEAAADPNAPEPILREAAAMLDLARQFKPREVRFARSSADVLLRLGERDRALEALAALRALDPKDQLAQIQFVDLSADKIETAEAKVAYLKQIAGTTGIAPEVRSHAASSLMNLYFDRAQNSQAMEALSQAISLNPQNLAALRVKYDLAAESGVAADRAKALAAILQASPADASNLIGMAQECAAAGDYDNAGLYYNIGLNVVSGAGQTPPMDDFIDFVAVQMLANQTAAVEQFVEGAIQRVPNEPRLFALQLMLAMNNGKSDVELASQINAARGVYLAQLASVSQALNEPDNRTPPTTAPAVPYPNVTADAAKLTAPEGNASGLRSAYAVALAEQIWFDAYFRAAAVEPAALEALRSLVGDPNDPLVVRLEGWSLLAAGRNDEAVLKLTGVADRDGYAKLGLAAAAIAKHEDDKAKQILTELLTNRPAGMYGATVALAGKRAGVAAPAMTPAERSIAGLAGSLKNGVINLLNNPRTAYLLSSRPLTISTNWGEPILVEVRILNNGRDPITIGPGGLVPPRFSVDVASRGQPQKAFPGTVIGQWTGPVRLMPQQQLFQIVRIDRGPVASFLRQYPTIQFPMNGMITINPLIAERGSVAAPGGEQTTIGEGFERKPSPLHMPAFREAFVQKLRGGSPVERLYAGDLAATVCPLLRAQADNAEAQTLANDLQAVLDGQANSESQPELKAMATFYAGAASGDGNRLRAMVEQLATSDSLVGQAAALWGTRGAPAETRKAVAQKALAKQPKGPILELAQALAAQDDLPKPKPAPAPSEANP